MDTLLFFNLGGAELLVISFALIPVALMIFCLVEIARSTFRDGTVKLLWILIVLVAPLLGSLIYLLLGRNQRVLS